jgi:hypothetical protein
MKPVAAVAIMILSSALVMAQAPANSTKGADTRPEAAADNRPVTGARNLGLGSDSGQNTLQAGLSVAQSVTSNARLASGSSTDWSGVSTVSGNLELSRASKQTSTELSYRGGANFYTADSSMNSHDHQFGIAETFNLRRWTLVFADHFEYQPEGYSSSFGSLFGPDGADLRSTYLPDGSLLTPFTSRLMNTGVAELQYGFTRRTSVTASGSYSLMKFPDSSLLDSTERTLSGGLNHSFGRNTVGVGYTNTMFKYDSVPVTMMTHGVELTFARRVTGRLSFEAGAGPQVLVTTIAGVDGNELLATGHLAIRRQDGRTASSLSYSHGVTGGSGVTPGAKTDQVMAGVDHAFSRGVTVMASTGFARNEAMLGPLTYNTFHATGGVTRHLGRNASLSLTYFFQRQLSNGAFDHMQSHTVMFSFNWAFRPVRFK